MTAFSFPDDSLVICVSNSSPQNTVVFENEDPAAAAAVEQNSAPVAEARRPPEGKVFKLPKPVTINGKEFTELNLDGDMLSGWDLKSAEREYRTRFKDGLNIPFAGMTARTLFAGETRNERAQLPIPKSRRSNERGN